MPSSPTLTPPSPPPIPSSTSLSPPADLNLIERYPEPTSKRRLNSKQAERMVKRNRVELSPGEIEDNVAIPIPMVDRGRRDPRNIFGVIIDRNENDLYTVAVRDRVLKHKYTRIDVNLCKQRLLTISDINTEHKIPRNIVLSRL